MINLSLNELKLIPKVEVLKTIKTSLMMKYQILNEPESKIIPPKLRIKEIKKDLNQLKDGFSKWKIKEIRRNLYDIKNKNKIFTQKIKEIEENLYEVGKNLSKLKKYYDYDDIEYTGIRGVGNLFNLSIDEDYHKPIRTNSAFNKSYIEYESKGDKDNILSIKKYPNIIWPYLKDIINDHKT